MLLASATATTGDRRRQGSRRQVPLTPGIGPHATRDLHGPQDHTLLHLRRDHRGPPRCAVITARNPVHSALFLVLAFFTAACIWILLEAEFLAITLVLVYVGAVMVLFSVRS